MRKTAQLYALAVALVALGPAAVRADSVDPTTGGALEGVVTAASQPLPTALVYAYQLADFSLQEVTTDEEGSFLFDQLPAGLYKVIAYKSGFVPTIALLSRATSEARQFLDIQLVEEATAEAAGEGFWSVRERIPGDVLRRIEGAQAEAEVLLATQILPGVELDRFEAEMSAVTGMDERTELGRAHVAGAEVGIRGGIGDISIGLSGNFVAMEPSDRRAADVAGAGGQTRLVSLNVQNGNAAGVRVTSLDNRMVTEDGGDHTVGFERHRVDWSSRVGERGRTDISAQYTDESNFYRQGPIQPIGLPQASRSLRVEGSYATAVTERATIETGFRYHERRGDYADGDAYALLPKETVDLFGRSGLQVNPALLIEVGFYSTMRDGSLAVAPSGGLVFKLGPDWQAFTSASLKAHEQAVDDPRRDFTPVYYDEHATCRQADEYCYQVLLARVSDSKENLTFGATHRRFADTLQLYFDQDFFSNLNQSLYLVRGDSLPELQFELTRRLGPNVLAKLESNLAAGGGGVLLTGDDTPYENEVRYLVTSLDTLFEQTSTGVFLSFQHMAQELNPIERASLVARSASPAMELERLQLGLTQDLDLFNRLASDWILRLNMEVSRGSGAGTDTLPYVEEADEEELRKRVMGGLAVKF